MMRETPSTSFLLSAARNNTKSTKATARSFSALSSILLAQLELSRLLRRSEPERASQLLEDADVEAHKIPVGQPERVYALAGLAAAFFSSDRFRSWAIAAEVVKAGNGIPSFSGEEAKLTARLRIKNVMCMVDYDEASFNVANLFSLLATDNAEVALSTSSSLASDSLRAAAQ